MAQPGITCVMYPSHPAMRTLTQAGVGPHERRVGVLLDELMAVDTFANLLDEAMLATTGGAGTLDLKEVAAYVLRRMKEHQR